MRAHPAAPSRRVAAAFVVSEYKLSMRQQSSSFHDSPLALLDDQLWGCGWDRKAGYGLLIQRLLKLQSMGLMIAMWKTIRS
jgi:hypothetical protein